MKKLLTLLALVLATSAQAITTNPASAVTADSDATALTIPYRDSSGMFKVGNLAASAYPGAIIGQVNYTQVSDTTTRTSGAGALTVFSTITIPANTLARNGDSISLSCWGTLNTDSEIRTLVLKLGRVVVSSRTLTLGTATTASNWLAQVRLVRTSAGNQVRFCDMGANHNNCNTAATMPSIGAGTNTIDETAAQTFTCSADNITAGSTSFLYSNVRFEPGS